MEDGQVKSISYSPQKYEIAPGRSRRTRKGFEYAVAASSERLYLPEPGARNFACGANYLAPGWFNFAAVRVEHYYVVTA
jgi:hypothetical protein